PADFTITLARLAVAGDAVLGKQFFPRGDIALPRLAVKRHHVIGELLDLRRLQHAIGTEARHRAGASIWMVAAHAIGDGAGNILDLAAPQPGARGERRIARIAAAAGAVAGLAIIGEGNAPGDLRRRLQLRVLADFAERQR